MLSVSFLADFEHFLQRFPCGNLVTDFNFFLNATGPFLIRDNFGKFSKSFFEHFNIANTTLKQGFMQEDFQHIDKTSLTNLKTKLHA